MCHRKRFKQVLKDLSKAFQQAAISPRNRADADYDAVRKERRIRLVTSNPRPKFLPTVIVG